MVEASKPICAAIIGAWSEKLTRLLPMLPEGYKKFCCSATHGAGTIAAMDNDIKSPFKGKGDRIALF